MVFFCLLFIFIFTSICRLLNVTWHALYHNALIRSKQAFSSKTVGKNRELLVSKAHLDPEDRILVVDDFLSSGAIQEALLRIVSDSGATAVGVGVLIEKVYDSGRQFLSGYAVPVESMVRVASVKDGVIQLMEEEGFDDM